MDLGQAIFAYSRLILGAAAAFLAIMLWSKTRDIAWMLIVVGILAAYIGIIYSILDMFGFTSGVFPMIGTVQLAAILLSCIQMLFFIAAFLIMVIRRRKI